MNKRRSKKITKPRDESDIHEPLEKVQVLDPAVVDIDDYDYETESDSTSSVTEFDDWRLVDSDN